MPLAGRTVRENSTAPGDQMIGAGAGQDFPLTGSQSGTVPQDQGLYQRLPGRVRQDLPDTLPQPLAPTIDDIDAGSGVQAPVFAPAADVAHGLDALLEQPALVIESAGIGEALGSLEASGQAPAFAGPQRRGLPIPAQAHQPLEHAHVRPETETVRCRRRLLPQASDPAGQLQIPAHKGLGKGFAEDLAGLDPDLQEAD